MKLLPLATLLATLLSPLLLRAESWDLARDFSKDRNPNGQWFYGFSSYGGRTLTPLSTASNILGMPGLNGWAVEVGTFPFISKNTTGTEIAGPGFEVPTGEVVLHPGNAPAEILSKVVFLSFCRRHFDGIKRVG
jgi:hypothetical protein